MSINKVNGDTATEAVDVIKAEDIIDAINSIQKAMQPKLQYAMGISAAAKLLSELDMGHINVEVETRIDIGFAIIHVNSLLDKNQIIKIPSDINYLWRKHDANL